MLKLTRLPTGFQIINPDGTVTNAYQLWWQANANAIENSVNGVEAALIAAGIALDAAAVANEAADNANEAASTNSAESSIVNSGIINVATPPLLSADSAGTITISTHDRQYGNQTLNPTVTVNGDALTTAYVADDVVYVFYDQASRAGGTVAYQTSLIPADGTQGGDRHSVGVVVIPMAGSGDGNFVQPPGVLPTP